MVLQDVALVVIAVAVVIGVAVIVPVAIELSQLIAQSKRTLQLLNEELVPLLERLRSLAERVQHMVSDVQSGTARVTALMHSVGGLRDTVERTQDAFRRKSHNMMANLMVLQSGVSSVAAWFKQKPERSSNGNSVH